jgi:hypothetical protein
MSEILPDSRAKRATRIIYANGMSWVPIFCANCGADGGYVPEQNMDFAFYLCNDCADRLPPIDGTYVMPDEEFWQKVKEANGDYRLLEMLRKDKEKDRADGIHK